MKYTAAIIANKVVVHTGESWFPGPSVRECEGMCMRYADSEVCSRVVTRSGGAGGRVHLDDLTEPDATRHGVVSVAVGEEMVTDCDILLYYKSAQGAM